MAICSVCYRDVAFKNIDVGIGVTEAWGVVQNHKDVQWLSPCCEAPEYTLTGAENYWLVDLRDADIDWLEDISQVDMAALDQDIVICMTHENAEKVARMAERQFKERKKNAKAL